MSTKGLYPSPRETGCKRMTGTTSGGDIHTKERTTMRRVASILLLFAALLCWTVPVFAADATPEATYHWVAITAGFSMAIASDRKSTRLNSSHIQKSRMPSSA